MWWQSTPGASINSTPKQPDNLLMQHHFDHDGVRFNYYVDDFTDPWDPAPTIFMLHGAMANADRFRPWVPGLSRQYKVVRMDMRGHGKSSVPAADAELSMEILVNDTLALMDHLGCDAVHFVGNSAGGYVGQHLAMNHPERIATLALFGSAPGLKNSQASSWLPMVAEKGLRNFLADTIDDRFPPHMIGTPQVEMFLDALSDNDVPFIGKFVGYMATQEWSDQLHRITCPTLVVVPGAGRIGDASVYKPMKERMSRSEVLMYDGERHSICEYLPERCVTDLLSFLARHAGATQ
ncbi:alpha/beta fold hydrolase [Parapusillimonas granuli]|uniref:Alpha/beta fold hydrolase n=2 Tax=Parapusillimonas granuli TaxID=380911 RepID=A0A853G2Z8_9BURK|nr:alpha/beta fold hydrolase [Parapusillimonas granuli]